MRWTEALRLYLRLVAAQVRADMQYRASFLAEMVGQFLITLLDFAAVVVLLTRFTSLGSWTLPEVALLYGTSSVSFGLSELLSGAYDHFDRMVQRGDFDRMLLRPLGTVFQMVASEFHVRRLGRLSQGVVTLIIALELLRPAWGAGKWLFLGLTLAGGVVFFAAILIVGAAAAFWSPQTGELTNIFSYGGQLMTSYPMHIYQQWMRDLFTFVLPMAFINYYPALYLLGKPDPAGLPGWVAFLAPPVAALCLAGSIALWRVGVRRYQSTGT